MNILALTSWGGGILAFALIAMLLLSRRFSMPDLMLGVGVLCLGGEATFTGIAAISPTQASSVFWQNLAVICLVPLPAVWLLFALSFARGNQKEFLRKWRWTLVAAAVAPLTIGVAGGGTMVQSLITTGSPLQWHFAVRWPAVCLNALLLISAVLILMNLEWTFRASVGASRWKIKYAVIGLALLFGARIYTSSQVILYSSVSVSLAILNATALMVGCLLIGFSLLRFRLDRVDIYPSATAIRHSLTAALIGAYLLVVGVLADLAGLWGGTSAFPLKALMIFLALAVLAALALSDRVRQRMRRLVSRHFARPLHDYRAVWSIFTDRTASAVSRDEYCRAIVKLVSDTLEMLSVTLWLTSDGGNRLELAASTSVGSTTGRGGLEGDESVLQVMRDSLIANPRPVNLDTSTEPWCALLRESNPSRFPTGGNRFVVPLVSRGEFVGLLVLGDRVNGVPLVPDDFELLKCIGDHAGANLKNLRLSAKLLELREFEAFQTMSAFFVHDLKNTASTLSLMLRNMASHFDNPEFREDALRGLAKSVEHINELIARLALLRQRHEVHPKLADINQVLRSAMKSIEGLPGIKLQSQLEPIPQFLFDEQQIASVFTNLLVNARDAIQTSGDITVTSALQGSNAVVSVSDTGCGMTPEFISRSLFRPFQTTKKKGLGIGMFQTKIVVEAHSGRIELESRTGRGTVFKVFLPTQGNLIGGKP